MNRQNTEDAIAAARRVYTPSAMPREQIGISSSHHNPVQNAANRTYYEERPSGNSNYRPASITTGPRPAASSVGRMHESDQGGSISYPSFEPLQQAVEGLPKPANSFSDDARVTVVEEQSESDSADEGFLPEAMPVFHPSDQIFMVMGVTGAGKSTFISLLTDANVEVGHELQSSEV